MRGRVGGKTILFVEGTRFFRETVEKVLLEAGFRVLAAGSAGAALRLLEAEGGRVDLLLLDLHLSPTDGFDFLEHLRRLKPPERPPILAMLHGLEIEEAVQQLQGLQAVGVQDKRAALAQIVYRVSAVVTSRRAEQRAAVRVPLGLPVNYTLGRWQSQGIIFNLSKTGIFLSTDLPVEAGRRVRLQFILPGVPRLFDLAGIIVWTASSPAGVTPSGMAVKFLDLDAPTGGELTTFVTLETRRLNPTPIPTGAPGGESPRDPGEAPGDG